jgi:hypothetical protein
MADYKGLKQALESEQELIRMISQMNPNDLQYVVVVVRCLHTTAVAVLPCRARHACT